MSYTDLKSPVTRKYLESKTKNELIYSVKREFGKILSTERSKDEIIDEVYKLYHPRR